MDRIKRKKGIIAVATALFMLLSFAVPDMWMCRVLKVKAAGATYTDNMEFSDLFSPSYEEASNDYFEVAEDAVTIIAGNYKLASVDDPDGFKLTKKLVMKGGTIECKKWSNEPNKHNLHILTNGHDVEITGGEITSVDDKVEGVIRCTGSDADITDSGESIVTLSGTGKISGGKVSVLLDASFDGVFRMDGGSVVNETSEDGSACILSQDKTSTLEITGGSIKKTGTNNGGADCCAVALTGGTAVIGGGTGTVDISSSETTPNAR